MGSLKVGDQCRIFGTTRLISPFGACIHVKTLEMKPTTSDVGSRIEDDSSSANEIILTNKRSMYHILRSARLSPFRIKEIQQHVTDITNLEDSGLLTEKEIKNSREARKYLRNDSSSKNGNDENSQRREVLLFMEEHENDWLK